MNESKCNRILSLHNFRATARRVGLLPPYNFSVAIPFLLNAFLTTTAIATYIFLSFNGDLTFGSDRSIFIIVIILISLTAAALSFRPTTSYALLLWCCTELTIAALSETARPRDYFSEGRENRFAYHPLLGKVLKPSTVTVQHLDRRNAKAFEQDGWLINWNVIEGRDLRFVHNSIGTRDIEPTVEELKRPIIAAYGGSTTYEVTVTQERTWTEQLNSNLNGEFIVLNFGIPRASTTEHLTQTAFYERILGRWPTCALYYIGWNDIMNAYVADPDEAYADYWTLAQPEPKPDLYLARYSPTLKLLNRALTFRFDRVPSISKRASPTPIPASAEKLERIFVDHVDAISAINTSRGIRTVFIAQVLNREVDRLYQGQGSRLAQMQNNLKLQLRFNSVLRQASAANGSAYISPGMQNFSFDDFVDQGHFSESGSKKFADIIHSDVRKFCTVSR